jgi:vacuolar-type H+-ATPase subunit H
MAEETRTNWQPAEKVQKVALDAIRLALNPGQEVREAFDVASEPIAVHTVRPGGRRKIVRRGNLYQPGSQQVRKAKGDPMVACYNQSGDLIGLCDPDDLQEVAAGNAPGEDDDDDAPAASPQQAANDTKRLTAEAQSRDAQAAAPATKSLRKAMAPLLATYHDQIKREDARVRKSGRVPTDAVKVIQRLGTTANAERVMKGLKQETDTFYAGVLAYNGLPRAQKQAVDRQIRDSGYVARMRYRGKLAQIKAGYRG